MSNIARQLLRFGADCVGKKQNVEMKHTDRQSANCRNKYKLWLDLIGGHVTIAVYFGLYKR
jgi:hypothetical protein